MKALLTGITGNLGYEVCLELAKHGVKIIPIVRSEKTDFFSLFPIKFDQIIECDLVNDSQILFSEKADLIIHCAGNVHFNLSENDNQRMMLNVVNLAQKIKVPIYAVSTAFVYKPNGTEEGFNNNYETDKYYAEQILIESGVTHTIIRPSVLTGNSLTGEIQNFSGYYYIVRAFLLAIQKSLSKGSILRFPKLSGKSDMVPVDEAAKQIYQIVKYGKLGKILYITNPSPPFAEKILKDTLNFYGLENKINLLNIPFKEFEHLDLSVEELNLYKFASHFNHYWSMGYTFPESVCRDIFINTAYIEKILTEFQKKENAKKV